ncbi:MAG TPA: hypothetical protein VL966_07095 [Alphaproteobacteria bacterium]|jgi:hypothetical protein|nr:hypothetical protein [Alphaproteobacteria bacterium]
MVDLNTKILILRDAIYGRHAVRFSVSSLGRSLCPHALGTTRRGVWRVLGWQFDGESDGGAIPDWRCFDLGDIASEIESSVGPWHRGWRVRGAQQTWIEFIYAEVDPAFGAQIRDTSLLRIRAPALSLEVPKKR